MSAHQPRKGTRLSDGWMQGNLPKMGIACRTPARPQVGRALAPSIRLAMSFSDNAMGLSFQGVTVPSCEQIEMIQPYVTHILRVASGAGGQTAWRAEARGVMKMILSHERFEDAHLFMSLLHTAKAEMVDNVCANLLMSAYKKRNCLSQVLLVFSQLRALWQPDLVSFNIVVDACGKAKQVIGAHSGPRCADIVHALPADVSSFVPHVLPQVQLAFTFLEEMRAAGLGLLNYIHEVIMMAKE